MIDTAPPVCRSCGSAANLLYVCGNRIMDAASGDLIDVKPLALADDAPPFFICDYCVDEIPISDGL